MFIKQWLSTRRVRHGLSASAIVLAAGGMVLLRTPASARPGLPFSTNTSTVGQGPLPSGPNTVQFSGNGAHGTLSLTQTSVLAGAQRRVFAELRMVADASSEGRERAPLSMVVVLDTSGSMEGDKLRQAKDSVSALIRDMRDDDEIALVRYSSDSEVIQPLARVGSVRSELLSRVQGIVAGGGTNIAPALSHGLRALAESSKGRVRRVVLVSDGLDSTRAQSESTARDSAGRGITVSTMGIGLDFDERYMSAVAENGRGNFAFVNDGPALAAFLSRELKEGASTTVEAATARLTLPRGMRLVRAVGGDATQGEGGEVTVRLGSLFAGDERRVTLELDVQLGDGEQAPLGGQVTWDRVGGGPASATLAGLQVVGTSDSRTADASRDPAIGASVESAVASVRQMEAAEAYAKGDGARAQQIIAENVASLAAAATAAPAAEAEALRKQEAAYKATAGSFRDAPAASPEGKAKAKASVAQDTGNLGRKAAF